MNACEWLSRCKERSVSVDWMRLSGPRGRVEEASDVLCRFFGPKWEGSRGRFHLDAGRKWGDAAVFYDEDPESRWCVVEVPGGSCSLLSMAERRELCNELMCLGFKPTRLDVAVDVRGEAIGLVDDLVSSCRRGELVGARLWEPKEIRRGLDLVSHGVCIGKRGADGSGRYVRVYDKGLETGTAAAREWVRFEVEFSDQCANDVADAWTIGVECQFEHDQTVEEALLRRALGAFDLRVFNGARELSRRPVVAWWAAFVEGVHRLTVRAFRRLSNAAGYVSWTARAVWPQMQAYAAAVGLPVVEFVRACCGDVAPSEKAVRSQVGRELLAHIKGSGGVAWT